MVAFQDSKKFSNFIEWFLWVVREGEFADYIPHVKGSYYLPWWGYKATKNIIERLERRLEETGHKEVRFPCLIPYIHFRREKNFFEGFNPEAFVVERTLKGVTLGEPLILRPTSEAIMYAYYAERIKSWKQLPLKIYQTVNIFRCETKMTKPFLRMREVYFFNEAHTIHATKEEADKQIQEALRIYKETYDECCIPYIIVEIPKKELFPGACYQYDFVTILPDTRILELASIINLGQSFSKAFEIRFQDKDEQWKFAWQTCYGTGERVTAAVLAALGDDRGAVLPPNIAPLQVIIVPIYYKEHKEDVKQYALSILDELRKHGIEADIDLREDVTAGEKYYYWELRGVPLRIEVGPRDLSQRRVTLCRRDTLEKWSVELDKLIDEVKRALDNIYESLRSRTKEYIDNMIKKLLEEDALEKYISAIVPLCDECIEEFEEMYEKEVYGRIVEPKVELRNKKCIVCGKEGEPYLVGKTH